MTSSVAANALPDDPYTPAGLTSWVWLHFRLSRSDPDHAYCSIASCTRRKVARKRSNNNFARFRAGALLSSFIGDVIGFL